MKTGLKRLLTLARRLEKVPPKQFDLGFWKKSNCQTVACACGWAATIPSFRRAGLTMKLDFKETVAEGLLMERNGLRSIVLDVADEIERLRAENAELRKRLDLVTLPWIPGSNHPRDPLIGDKVV